MARSAPVIEDILNSATTESPASDEAVKELASWDGKVTTPELVEVS